MAHAEVRNRPLRVGATHREATKPSEASAERGRERRGVGEVKVKGGWGVGGGSHPGGWAVDEAVAARSAGDRVRQLAARRKVAGDMCVI